MTWLELLLTAALVLFCTFEIGRAKGPRPNPPK